MGSSTWVTEAEANSTPATVVDAPPVESAPVAPPEGVELLAKALATLSADELQKVAQLSVLQIGLAFMNVGG